MKTWALLTLAMVGAASTLAGTVKWTDSLTNSFRVLTNGIAYPQNSYTDTVHTAEDGGFYNLKVELGN